MTGGKGFIPLFVLRCYKTAWGVGLVLASLKIIIHRFFVAPGLALSCLILLASAAIAVPRKTAIRSGIQLKVSAVAPDTFHLVAYAAGNPPPPQSPFVVESGEWPGAVNANGASGSSVTTPSGEFVLDSRGNWQFTGREHPRLSGTVTSGDGKTVFTLRHGVGERFYGAGNEALDKSGDLTHPSGTAIVDNGATRVPFLWSTGGYGVFVANNQTSIAWADKDGTLTWTIPSSYGDVYLSIASDGYGLLDAQSRLTGRAPIPPRWTFGFMMSRWGYTDSADVRDKWRQFRDLRIPVDTFIYDYDWYVNDWEFNTKKMSPALISEMHRLGLRFVGIRKPRIYGENLEYARKQGWVLYNHHGTDLRFDVPDASYWWWSHHVPLVQAGVDGWWNDEAEQTLDEYFHMSRVQWEGWRQTSPRRVWSINRAFVPGIQRFGAATWTGDIHSTWSVLANQPGTMLNWSMAGMPYVSQDTGGFRGDPSPELYARWIQSSVFIPFMRVHGQKGAMRLPWEFGDEVLNATRKAIELRTRFIPYLYTFAEQTTRTGAPLMRPLVLEFPGDPKTFNLRDQWLLGDRLLVAPILSSGGKRDVYLPEGRWIDFNTGASIQGGHTQRVSAPLDTIPAYVRAGSIIPLGPVLQSTSLGASDPLEVRVYPGANAQFSLYEDEGDNYDYQQGACSRIPMKWDDASRTFSLGARDGTFPGMLQKRRLTVVLPDQTTRSLTYDGGAASVQF